MAVTTKTIPRPKSKRRTMAVPTTITFRPNRCHAKWLTALANDLGLSSVHEAARRTSIMCGTGFDLALHNLLVAISLYAPPDQVDPFAWACQVGGSHFKKIDAENKAQGKPPVTREERLASLIRTIRHWNENESRADVRERSAALLDRELITAGIPTDWQP